jgi:hypothetical protein
MSFNSGRPGPPAQQVEAAVTDHGRLDEVPADAHGDHLQ